jgi:selenocysteine lyase/cysteine desulfurase
VSDIESARDLWPDSSGWLNTATYGLPPAPALAALRDCVDDWSAGRTSWEVWNGAADAARECWSRLVGVDSADVAVGAQVSQMLAPIASSLPSGTTVLAPATDFTSTLFPWAVHADRGVDLVTVPVEELSAAIRPGVDVVVFSLVQSADGTVVELAEVSHAAREIGAMVVVDASQACGWLPFDATLADVVVCVGYKWLLSPRGTGFVYLAPWVREKARPLMAGWYAGADPMATFYGMPLRLAADARAFDLSPAWQAWVGTLPALELLERVGIDQVHEHDVSLANRFLAGLGLPAGRSAIVAVDIPDAEARLARVGVRTAGRAGRVRASFHLYNTTDDVDTALVALTR